MADYSDVARSAVDDLAEELDALRTAVRVLWERDRIQIDPRPWMISSHADEAFVRAVGEDIGNEPPAADIDAGRSSGSTTEGTK